MEQARLGILPRPGGGLEQLHHRAHDVEDQDDERFLRRFEPESEHAKLDQHGADRDCVIAVQRGIVGPEEMRAQQQREHQGAEQARPALLETESEELEEPARAVPARPPSLRAASGRRGSGCGRARRRDIDGDPGDQCGSRKEQRLREDRAGKAAQGNEGDGAAEIGLVDFPLDGIVGHHRQLRVDEGKEQDRRKTVDQRRELRCGHAEFGREITGVERRDDTDGEQRLREAVGDQHAPADPLRHFPALEVREAGKGERLAERAQSAGAHGFQRQLRRRAVVLIPADRGGEHALAGRYEQDSGERRDTRGGEHELHVDEQRGAAAVMDAAFRCVSARKGPRKLFDVREKSTRMLNSANDIAMRRVRTPAIRAA